MRTVFLDTETTGLKSSSSGIVELAIVSEDGETLLQSLVNPWPYKEWPEAQAIHGISPDMVKYAPMIHDLWPAIFKHVQGSRVVIYNAAYDRAFFPGGDLLGCDVVCAMLRWSNYKKVPGQRGGSFKWFKLTEASEEAGHVWTGSAHRALADTLAARTVWRFLDEREKK